MKTDIDKEQKKYVSLIRRTVFSESFLIQYFLKMVIVYLLMKNVTEWVAVSIPVVVEISQIFVRIFPQMVIWANKINFKKYFMFYIVTSVILCALTAISTNIFVIYTLSFIIGSLGGIFNTCVTRINTSNPKYESICFVEQERSQVLGATCGLIISQILYDINPNLYLIGFLVFGLIFTLLNIKVTNISSKNDSMANENTVEDIPKDEKKNIILLSLVFGLICAFWGITLNAYNELLPLITNKLGYLNAIYYGVEIIAILVINEKIIEKFSENGTLLKWEIICAFCDISYLLLVALIPSNTSIAIAMFLCGISSTLGDPIYGKLISKYSQNDRNKYVVVYNTFFKIRFVFTIFSLFICRIFVLKGIASFKYLAIALFAVTFILYVLLEKMNKKILGDRV